METQTTLLQSCKKLGMVREFRGFMCGEVYLREKVAGNEHGEVERDQNMEVLVCPLTCHYLGWIFGSILY